MNIFRRNHYITSIAYYYLTEKSGFGYRDYVTIPEEFRSGITKLVPTLPTDFLQVFNTLKFFRHKCNEVSATSLNFNVLYYDDVPDFIDRPLDYNIKVFLLDKKRGGEHAIMSRLAQLENTYFTFLKEEPALEEEITRSYPDLYFNDALELIANIKRDKSAIINTFQKSGINNNSNLGQLNDFVENEQEIPAALERITLFKGAQSNFFIKNQITSNYWQHKDAVDYPEEVIETKRKEFMIDPAQGRATFSRLNNLNEQIAAIDEVHKENALPSPVSDIDYLLKPLIIALPFHNPQQNKLSGLFDVQLSKEVQKLANTEQDKNYIFRGTTDSEINEGEGNLVLEFELRKHAAVLSSLLVPRVQYMDFIAYLHATFTLSPILRLPFIGKVIKKELAFLKPGTKNNLKGTRLNKTISAFGERLNKLLLVDGLEKTLSRRDGQVVAVSDLPVEWLKIKGLPFSLTHDICRIPETNLRTPMNLFGLNNNFQYVVPKDIRDKTLVLFGAPETDVEFQAVNAVVREECARLGIKTIDCKSVNEFMSAIEEEKPELLIIDCHGEIDYDTLSSYLLINNEKLSAEMLLERKIQVPLVFLSACSTNPNFGFVHSIANAFLFNGSFSVSTTFLPISIRNGSITYLRLLLHLDQTARNGDFPNWLSYVSHITRTSAFTNLWLRLEEQLNKLSVNKRKDTDKILTSLDKIKDKTVSFSTRRATFEKIDQLLNELSKNVRLSFQSIMHENLLYSHIGRSDLISFQSWMERKQEKNTKLHAELAAALQVND